MSALKPEQLEQLLKTVDGRKRLTIGLPKCDRPEASLTLLTPEGVAMLVAKGMEVLIEKDFGTSIQYPDSRYTAVGAVVESRHIVLGADVVMSPENPSNADAGYLKPNGILLTLVNNRSLKLETARILLERRITMIALDMVRDHRGLRPLADILDEVDGRATIAAALSFLTSSHKGKGILLGGVSGVNPCEVVILGTGMAALAAARSAIGLGGMVRLFDRDPYCLRAAMTELGPAVIGSAFHPTVLGHALTSADVVVATKLHSNFAVDDSVIDNMKKGVIIFDLDDHSGISGTFPSLKCVDVTRALENGVAAGSDICFVNPIGTVRRTAAMALTNDIVPLLDRLFGSGKGLVNVLKTDKGLRDAVTLFGGRVVSRELAEKNNLRYVDINLILSFS